MTGTTVPAGAKNDRTLILPSRLKLTKGVIIYNLRGSTFIKNGFQTVYYGTQARVSQYGAKLQNAHWFTKVSLQ